MSGIAGAIAEHEEFPGLDSIRAFASIAVLGTHVAFWSGFYPRGTLGTMTARLDIGVAIFFVLSGFLLSRPFLRRWRDGRRRPPTGRYFWKRTIRVMPMALLVTAGALLLLPENEGASLGTWIRNLTLTELYLEDGLPAGLTHLWSLATEIAFYVALPIIMAVFTLIARGRRSPASVLVLCALLTVVTIVWIVEFSDVSPSASQWLFGHFAWFAAGIALAALQLWSTWRPAPISAIHQLAQQPGACWVLAASGFMVASTPLAGPASLLPASTTEHLTKVLIYTVVATLIVLPSALGPRDDSTTYARFMGSRPLRHLGLISYSIFCVHLLVLHGISTWFDFPVFGGRGWELFALTLLGTLLVSEVTYRLVERPAMRLRTLGRRSPTAPTTAPSEASASH